MAPRQTKGFIIPVVLGILLIMLIVSFGLYSRFSQQSRQTVVADQSAVARYFLESYVSDVLWQIRKNNNKFDSDVHKAFRSGLPMNVCPVDYRPGSLILKLAEELKIEPGEVSASFKDVTALTFNAAAFNSNGTNEEKKGSLVIKCSIRFAERNYSLETSYPFKVVMTTSPILRKFIMFFDQLHLEQTAEFGARDKINVVPIQNNLSPARLSPISLYGWHLDKREMNGQVFLGHDDHEIRLNLVGGTFDRSPPPNRTNLEDLWQVSPSAFSVTADMDEFDQEELLTDSNGNSLIVRGASVPMVYRGHYARIGLLGFSDELLDSDFLGNFKIENFLGADPSFSQLRHPESNMKQASALRLFGNKIFDNFNGFQRDIYGRVLSRFFLLSFFDAPSVGVPISFNPDPAHTITIPQYGGAQRIPFKPVSGNYTSHMSRIVSGSSNSSILGDEANVPANRNSELQHKQLCAQDFQPVDGLSPRQGFSKVSAAWFNPSAIRPGRRPESSPGSVIERVSRFFRNGNDLKKHSGLKDERSKRFWIDGVVYVNGPLDLSEGIEVDDIRGGIVLVNGPIRLGNITREMGSTPSEREMREIKQIPLHQVLTFVSLTGDKITLTGNKYYGVQLFSFRPNLTGPIEQISFEKGNDLVFIGGLGLSTPNLASIIRQMPAHGVYPYFNYLPALGADENFYAVNIAENLNYYEFQVH